MVTCASTKDVVTTTDKVSGRHSTFQLNWWTGQVANLNHHSLAFIIKQLQHYFRKTPNKIFFFFKMVRGWFSDGHEGGASSDKNRFFLVILGQQHRFKVLEAIYIYKNRNRPAFVSRLMPSNNFEIVFKGTMIVAYEKRHECPCEYYGESCQIDENRTLFICALALINLALQYLAYRRFDVFSWNKKKRDLFAKLVIVNIAIFILSMNLHGKLIQEINSN